MRQGYRVSLLPAINLCQMSELSLVLLTLGLHSGDVSENTIGIAAFAFCFLAVGSTYAILKNDLLLRMTLPWLNKMRFHDLDHTVFIAAGGEKQSIILLGFSWTASSSLLDEIQREQPSLLAEITVVDFNPVVYSLLRQRWRAHVLRRHRPARCPVTVTGVQSEIIICSTQQFCAGRTI